LLSLDTYEMAKFLDVHSFHSLGESAVKSSNFPHQMNLV
jgi:hypothetical protein